MKNTGLTYEKLVHAVFTAFTKQSGVKTIDVAHDRQVEGRSGASHQVDVYWEFEVAGIRYRTIVSCKDWNSRVKKEQVMSLQGLLDDLPGQARGVLVSRLGFQAGAVDYAKAQGIVLYQLDEAGDDFWSGLVRRIELTAHLYEPRTSNVELKFDIPWLQTKKAELGLSELRISISNQSDAVMLVRDDGGSVGSVATVIWSYIPDDYVTMQSTRYSHVFQQATYVLMQEGSPIAQAKINAIEFDLEILLHEELIVVDADGFVQYVLTDILGKKTYTVDKELTSVRPHDPT